MVTDIKTLSACLPAMLAGRRPVVVAGGQNKKKFPECSEFFQCQNLCFGYAKIIFQAKNLLNKTHILHTPKHKILHLPKNSFWTYSKTDFRHSKNSFSYS